MMASIQQTPAETAAGSSDLSTVQQLVFSVGQLKFSMRTLSSMQAQACLLSQKETETSDHPIPLESNRVLENIIDEVFSKKSDHIDKSASKNKANETAKSISMDDLELIQNRLQEEFEKRRLDFITALSEKLTE